ncbi:MAG: hypothetical protein FJW14_18010 [Acidimicrobiia bacterium]|nr:hypothetical protein [Acidimicrobiia bacterium]
MNRAAVAAFAAGVLVTAGVFIALGGLPAAQSSASEATPSPGAIPRMPDGTPDLTGVWLGGSTNDYNIPDLLALYQPWARTQMETLSEKDDPTLRCMPYSYPRAFTTPHPVQVVQHQNPGVVVVLTETLHSFRVIPTDGSPHPVDIMYPTYQGDSVGRWEGDTLVVDVVGFNDRTWLVDGREEPSGWVHSDALRVTERWRLVDANTLEYVATVEDPKVLTGPWTQQPMRVKRAPFNKVFEAVCLDTTTHALAEAAARQP